MSRWSREEWLNDLDAKAVKRVRRQIEDHGFWTYVDSQQNAHTHMGECETRLHPVTGRRTICTDWRHVRGDDTCLAANSSLLQCRQQTLPGLPFCGPHFDRVWEAVQAFVSTERVAELTREAEFDAQRMRESARRKVLREEAAVAVEVATLRDARRALAAQPERVYFFASGHAVKIGRSINPEQRVRTLGATLAPKDVNVRAGHLIGTIPGGSAVEHALHMRFRPHRLVGEWFSLEPIRESIAVVIKEAERATPVLEDTA